MKVKQWKTTKNAVLRVFTLFYLLERVIVLLFECILRTQSRNKFDFKLFKKSTKVLKFFKNIVILNFQLNYVPPFFFGSVASAKIKHQVLN